MSNIKHILKTLIIIFLCIGKLSSQTITEQFDQIVDVYRNLQSCSVKIKTTLYPVDLDSKPTRTFLSEKRFSVTGSIVKNDNVEYFTNSHCQIMIDHSSKVVIYRNSDVTNELNGARQKEISIFSDSLFLKYHTFDISLKSDSILEMRATAKFQTINAPVTTIFQFSIPTKKITRVTYLYSSQSSYAKVEMIFTYMDLNPTFPSDTFSITHYIDGEGLSAKLSKKLDNYQFHNQFNLKNNSDESK